MWNYERNEQVFPVLPEGKYRIRIKSAEKAVSQKGREMLVLQFEISGNKATIFHYIVFMEEHKEITNRNLTQFFDSFSGIAEGDLDTQHWIGKVGAAMIKHEEYEGKTKLKISYFIKADEAKDLPAWIDADGNSVDNAGFITIDDADVPF